MLANPALGAGFPESNMGVASAVAAVATSPMKKARVAPASDLACNEPGTEPVVAVRSPNEPGRKADCKDRGGSERKGVGTALVGGFAPPIAVQEPPDSPSESVEAHSRNDPNSLTESLVEKWVDAS